MTRVYEEMVDFVARGSTPDEVANWTPSQKVCDRVSEMLHKESDGKLSPSERTELNHFFELEQIMRLAKARARSLL